MKEIILTGIRSNEEPTLGNYLGAMLPMVELQKRYSGQKQINMFVPDLHSFTTPIDHGRLYDNTINNLKYFIAAGLDINDPDTYIYRQSRIPAHSELTIILNNFTYFGELNRMTQFKEKSLGSDNISIGLFDYPVLMASDILLYQARWVPVGDDQKQHLELTRDIAHRFNQRFGDVFVVPERWSLQFQLLHADKGVRIRSLSNPNNKMSKSINDPRGTILLNDNPDSAAKKIMSATTDDKRSIQYDWKFQPGITNLLQILSLLSGLPQVEINMQWEGKSEYGELKTAVANAVRSFLQNFQNKYESIDESHLMNKLKSSEIAMNKTANSTLHSVYSVVGLNK